MNNSELLRHQADAAFNDLLAVLGGLTEPESWGILKCRPGEYLHTEGSILSNIVHIASCKFMYASAAYRNLDLRWRDVIQRMDAFWPSLDGAMAWLLESQAHWLESWAGETDFERPVKTNWNETWPSWKVIWTVTHHDAYHAGQIQMLRSVVEPSEVPPPAEGHIWLEYTHEYSR